MLWFIERSNLRLGERRRYESALKGAIWQTFSTHALWIPFVGKRKGKGKKALITVECSWMSWNKLSRQRAPRGDKRHLHSAQNWGTWLKKVNCRSNTSHHALALIWSSYISNFLQRTMNLFQDFCTTKMLSFKFNNQSHESYIKVMTVNQRAKDEGIAFEKPTSVNMQQFLVEMSV